MKHCKSLLVSTFASGKLGNLLGYFQTQDSLSVFHHSLTGVHRVAWSVRSHTGYLELIIWRKATHSRTSSHLLMATGKKGETGNITIWDFSDRISCSSHANVGSPEKTYLPHSANLWSALSGKTQGGCQNTRMGQRPFTLSSNQKTVRFNQRVKASKWDKLYVITYVSGYSNYVNHWLYADGPGRTEKICSINPK